MIYKQPRQDLDLCGNSFARYSEKCSTQIYRALYGAAMLVPIYIYILALEWVCSINRFRQPKTTLSVVI